MLIIGIAGGTGSGKTTVVREIVKGFGNDDVAIISQDAYYKDLSSLPLEKRKEANFDHPNSIEFDLLANQINLLKEGKSIEEPIYSYITCTRSEETLLIKPKKVIIVEGILILTNQKLRDLFDIKIFVETSADDRLVRLIKRDTIERGRDVNEVLERYHKTVKPMHIQFIEPTKIFADLIIPQGGENKVAIDVMATVIEKKLSI
ncbi:MAG: uridine kinase [Ichthyobacteriaceae bacterium]|nr:uridine kinase [Ichthyobacteriaceae bacterium]